MKRKRAQDQKSDPRAMKKRKKKGFFHKPGEKVNELKDVDEKILREKENDYYQCMTNSKGRKESQVSSGEWSHKHERVRIIDQKGKLCANMGRRIEGKKHLSVYETMYLMERSLLCVRIPKSDEKDPEYDNLESVQDSLNFLMSHTNSFNLDHFVVFSHLKNLGYLVHEYDEKKFEEAEEEEEDEDEDDDEKEEEEEEEEEMTRRKNVKKKKKKKKGVQKTSTPFDNLNFEELEAVEESRGWNIPSQVIKGDENAIQPPPILPPPPPISTSNESGFLPLVPVTDNQREKYPSAEEIMKSIDIIPQNNQIIEEEEEEEGDDKKNETEVEVIFSCWRKESFGKSIVPYDQLKKPDFVISITRYSDHFPSFKDIHEICSKFSPVPVFFGIVESGHVVFMELNCFNVSQNK